MIIWPCRFYWLFFRNQVSFIYLCMDGRYNALALTPFCWRLGVVKGRVTVMDYLRRLG